MVENRKIVVNEPFKVGVVTELLDETRLEADEILVKKRYTLVSAGTESACITGRELWFKLPGVLGYSAVGEIVAVGSGVSGYEAGEIIYFQGKHSDYEIIHSGDLILHVRDQKDLEYIPFLRMAAISSSAIRASNIEFGDDVLITGQGLIGLMAMQLARLQGARVIVSDTSDLRLETAKELGADFVLNPGGCDMMEEIKKITGGRMVTTVIDATGSAPVICDALRYAQPGGEAILLGSPRAPYEANVTQVLQYIHQFRFRIDVKGAHEFRYPARKTPYVKHSTERTLEILMDYVSSERFNVKAIMSHLIKPEDAPEVYRKLQEKDESYLGIVYDWNGRGM